MKRVLLLVFSYLIFSPSIIFAQNAVVNANVISSVSPSISTFVSDLSSLPADGTSIVIFTATVLNTSGDPLPSKTVVVSSNRGEVDLIRCYIGNTLTTENQTTTDAEGKARCVSSSLAAGDATFTAVADGITLNNKPTITFAPLPVLQKLTVKVKLPGGGEITIIEPPKPKPSPTPPVIPPANQKLVDTSVGFDIPFWLFIATIMLILLVPLLVLITTIMFRQMRLAFLAEKRFEEREQNLLEKIFLLEQKIASETESIEQQAERIEKDVTLDQTNSGPGQQL